MVQKQWWVKVLTSWPQSRQWLQIEYVDNFISEWPWRNCKCYWGHQISTLKKMSIFCVKEWEIYKKYLWCIPKYSDWLEEKHPCDWVVNCSHCCFFLKDFIYLFLERRKRRKKERERNSDWLPLTPPHGDLDCNPGMCPDWESNQWPFGLQAGIQSTEPNEPGLFTLF